MILLVCYKSLYQGIFSTTIVIGFRDRVSATLLRVLFQYLISRSYCWSSSNVHLLDVWWEIPVSIATSETSLCYYYKGISNPASGEFSIRGIQALSRCNFVLPDLTCSLRILWRAPLSGSFVWVWFRDRYCSRQFIMANSTHALTHVSALPWHGASVELLSCYAKLHCQKRQCNIFWTRLVYSIDPNINSALHWVSFHLPNTIILKHWDNAHKLNVWHWTFSAHNVLCRIPYKINLEKLGHAKG